MIPILFASMLFVAQPPAAPPPQQPRPMRQPTVTEIRKADGTLVARALVWPGEAGVEVVIQAAGLPPGRYGVHLHTVGRCEGPSFESAGPHWNPTNRQHGLENPQGPHLGDLANFEIDAEGVGRLEFTIRGAELEGAGGLLDPDGAALVIHADPDDNRTDPSGNSGARIACGVITGPAAVS